MLRLTSILLSASLLLSTAQASAAVALKDIVNNFTYTAQVEGDQARAAAELRADLLAAQAQGVDAEEMINFAISQVSDQRVAAELRSVFASVDANRLSFDEASTNFREILSRNGQQGASWSGSMQTLGVVGILVVFVVILSVTSGPGLCADPAYYETHQNICEADYN